MSSFGGNAQYGTPGFIDPCTAEFRKGIYFLELHDSITLPEENPRLSWRTDCVGILWSLHVMCMCNEGVLTFGTPEIPMLSSNSRRCLW